MTGERSDHDLLIEMNTKLDIALLTVNDHENRLRRIEAKVWQLSGLGALLGASIGTGATTWFGR